MAALDIDGLTKVYRRGFWGRPHTALEDLTLAVEEREIFGFLGRNGAGKTTTFKILMGLMPATAGSARILGRDANEPSVRRRVGFLPEEAYFYAYLTARELLVFYGRLQGLRRREVEERSGALLERVGLAGAGDTRLGEYSKGMRQRFGIAQALVNDPQVLFLDEPLSGLDPLGRKEVKDLLTGLRDQGKTVFFSSHILADAEALCDRVGLLDRGRLAALGGLSELLRDRVRTFEVSVEGLDEAALAELGVAPESVRKDGEGFRFALGGSEDPDAWVRRLHGRGGRLRSLEPYRQTLEDYFVRRSTEPDGEEPS